jgi:hypothetical protein
LTMYLIQIVRRSNNLRVELDPARVENRKV